MRWARTWRSDPVMCALADRHYNRQRPGWPNFVGPAPHLVLRTIAGDALWVTTWPAHRRDDWADTWHCAIFRNESDHLSSELIVEAVAATRAHWPATPERGIVTYVDPGKIRRKRDPGRCFIRAGWTRIGTSIEHALVLLQQLPQAMPAPEPALDPQLTLPIA